MEREEQQGDEGRESGGFLDFGSSEGAEAESGQAEPEDEAAETESEASEDDDELLFGDGESEDEDEGSLEAAEKEEGEEEEESEPRKGSRAEKRIRELAGRTKDAERRADHAEARLSDLETYREQSEPIVEAFRRHYGRFPKPVEQLEWDSQYVDAADALFREGDATVKAAQAKVLARMKGERVETSPRQEERREAKPSVDDARLDRIERNQARSDIRDYLSEQKVQEPFYTILENAMVEQVDLSNRTPEALESLANSVLRKNRLTRKLVTQPTAKSRARPPGQRSGTRAAQGRREEESESTAKGKKGQEKEPKTTNEWMERNRRRLRTITEEMRAQ